MLAAFLYHTLNIGAMYFLNMIGWNVWLMEAVLTVFLLVNIYLIYSFWKEESAIEEDEEFTDDVSDEDEISVDEDDIDEISVDEDDTDEISEVIDRADDDMAGEK
jgi:Ca2+/Na+ antiporter